MPDKPEAIDRYLSDVLIRRRAPAFLEISGTGRLVSCSGHLGLYGLSNLELDLEATDQVPMLVGLLRRCDPPALLPQIQTPSGRHADVHIMPVAERHWVILLDAEEDYAARLPYQQQANELSLLKQRQEKLEESDGREIAETAGPLLAALIETVR